MKDEGVMAMLTEVSLLAGNQWMKVRDGNHTLSPLLLTLPSLPRHLLKNFYFSSHHLTVRNLTGTSEQKLWEDAKNLKDSNSRWLITSSAEWLRIEVFSWGNATNETLNAHLGFSLLARASGNKSLHTVKVIAILSVCTWSVTS